MPESDEETVSKSLAPSIASGGAQAVLQWCNCRFPNPSDGANPLSLQQPVAALSDLLGHSVPSVFLQTVLLSSQVLKAGNKHHFSFPG